jgi:hypothetical protein
MSKDTYQTKQSLIHDVISIPHYTKGNWYFQTEADACTNIIRCDGGKGFETLYIGSCAQSSDIESQANAQLMASAPDLLEALIEVVRISDRNHNAWDKAKKAIEKALVIKEKGIF